MIKYLHYKHRFLIGFSFFLGSLTACQIKESNISTQTTTCIPKYLPLLDEVERFQCYLSDDKARADCIEKIKEKMQQSNRNIHLKQLEKAKITQNNLTEVIYNYTAKLLTGKIPINDYLHFLLKQRMSFLEKRTCDIKTYWEELFTLKGTNKPFYPPTNYDLFTWLMTDPTLKLHKEINQKCKQDIINRYTMFNQIIVKAFHLTSFTELEALTILLLRASVSLHPLFKNPNCNNPRVHIPDYASGYAIILPLLKKHQKKYGDHFSKQKIVSLAFLDADQKKRTIEETSNFKKDVETQQYFNKVQSIDLFHYIGHWFYYPFALVPAAKTSSSISATAYDLGIWPYKLPNPNFLNPKLDKDIPDSEDALPPSFFRNHPFKKDEQVNNNDNSPLQDNNQVHVDDLNDSEMDDDDDQLPINNTIEQPDISSSKVFESKSKDKKQSHHDKRTQLQGKILDDIASQVAKKSGKVLARGLRIFHQKLFESTYPIRKLKKKQQNMVDAFFNPEKIADLSYRKFKALWCGVGGKILENTGSSHNILQDEKGNKIGNIFAHGKNQTYGKQYIKYIQSYLIYFGLVPSSLNSY